MLYSAINLSLRYFGIKRNMVIKEEISELINESSVAALKLEPKIDFAKLKEKNKDIVGYLKVNGTNIDYVVVKGNDNSFYLKHNLYKEYSLPGWIFIDYRNRLDGQDKNIIIYGHNTTDGSMFGTLKNAITKEWFENKNNHIINLVLENRILKYQVFSTYTVKVEDYYISTYFKNNNDFGKFVKTLQNRSFYDYQVDVNGDDSILTLSTCTTSRTSRMVLHAKLIDISY